MKTLNRRDFPGAQYPERIIQFGEGNFLRAFVDWQIDLLNEHTDLNSGVVVVRPIETSFPPSLSTQDGLYTTIIRGLNEKGEAVSDARLIRSVNREISVYSEYDEFLKLAHNPEMRFVFSNTTEAGISYHAGDKFDDAPAVSYPAKLTRLLFERFSHFNGALDKGWIIIPCELIDYNGDALRELVLRYAQEWALPEAIKAGRVRALAVERFDRRWNTERTVLLRLPQEDMCQTFGLPSSVKYESDGGPGIAQIMAFLMGSSEALKDRYDFMKFQVFQWLIGATDGHAKNFSVFIQAGGSYRLTPFYDIISAFPVLGGTGIHISDLKLAMGLNASKGKKTAIDKIYPRHFLATAKVLKFPEVQMHEILSDFARMIPAALDNVKTSLPTDFPENVVTAVETNVLRLHDRLSREYGIK